MGCWEGFGVACRGFGSLMGVWGRLWGFGRELGSLVGFWGWMGLWGPMWGFRVTSGVLAPCVGLQGPRSPHSPALTLPWTAGRGTAALTGGGSPPPPT